MFLTFNTEAEKTIVINSNYIVGAEKLDDGNWELTLPDRVTARVNSVTFDWIKEVLAGKWVSK